MDKRLYSTRSCWRIFVRCGNQAGRIEHRHLFVQDERWEAAQKILTLTVKMLLDELGEGSVPIHTDLKRIDGRLPMFEAIDAVGFDRD